MPAPCACHRPLSIPVASIAFRSTDVFWPCPSLNGWVAIFWTLPSQTCSKGQWSLLCWVHYCCPIRPSQVRICLGFRLQNPVGSGRGSEVNDIQHSGGGGVDALLVGIPPSGCCVANLVPPLPSAAAYGVIHCDPSVLHVTVVAVDTCVASGLGVSWLTDRSPSSSMRTRFNDSNNRWDTCCGIGDRICGD